MSSYEVPEPIICTPFEEPQEHWNIIEGEIPERVPGRRKAVYFYRDPKATPSKQAGEGIGTVIELKLVNLIRERVANWRRDSRGPGSTVDVDFWTSRQVREVVRSHVNYVVADTQRWEQSAAYYVDKHTAVAAFVKNAGLGFAIPYLYNGQMHDYLPDFLVRLKAADEAYLILETKGFDTLAEIKRAAAERWVAAVNADGSFGHWHYAIARKIEEVPRVVTEAATLISRES